MAYACPIDKAEQTMKLLSIPYFVGMTVLIMATTMEEETEEETMEEAVLLPLSPTLDYGPTHQCGLTE